MRHLRSKKLVHSVTHYYNIFFIHTIHQDEYILNKYFLHLSHKTQTFFPEREQRKETSSFNYLLYMSQDFTASFSLFVFQTGFLNLFFVKVLTAVVSTCDLKNCIKGNLGGHCVLGEKSLPCLPSPHPDVPLPKPFLFQSLTLCSLDL